MNSTTRLCAKSTAAGLLMLSFLLATANHAFTAQLDTGSCSLFVLGQSLDQFCASSDCSKPSKNIDLDLSNAQVELQGEQKSFNLKYPNYIESDRCNMIRAMNRMKTLEAKIASLKLAQVSQLRVNDRQKFDNDMVTCVSEHTSNETSTAPQAQSPVNAAQ